MATTTNPVYFEYMDSPTITRTLRYNSLCFIISSNLSLCLGNEIVYLTAINKETGEKTTHVFDSTNGEILTEDYIYFVKITDLNGNVKVEESRIYATGEFPHSKVYGICDSKCRVEVVTKAEFNETVSDTGWLTLREAGACNASGGQTLTLDTDLLYRKKNGCIYFYGKMSNYWSYSTAYPQIGVLDEAYRPTKEAVFNIPAYDSANKITRYVKLVIATNGVVSIQCTYPYEGANTFLCNDININVNYAI